MSLSFIQEIKTAFVKRRSTPPIPPPVPSVLSFDPYQKLKLRSLLGSGGFGFVFEANNFKLLKGRGRHALKVTFFENLATTTSDYSCHVKKQLREYEVHKSLPKHPNIVKFQSYFHRTFTGAEIEELIKIKSDVATDVRDKLGLYVVKANRHKQIDAICLTMERCESNLRLWLNEKFHQKGQLLTPTNYLPLPFFQLKIIQGLLDGLSHLHKHNVLHRDLKPENVMFSANHGRLPIKIGDFGLSRPLPTGEDSLLTSNVGTYDYMAPELCSKTYGVQSDLYSVGLIIWEVVQCIPPQRRRFYFDKLVNDGNEALVESHALIRNSKKIIIGLTKRDIEKRFHSVQDFNLIYRFVVNDSKEFMYCLAACKPSDVIKLNHGVFTGPFYVRQNNIIILGSREGTTVLRNSVEFGSNSSSLQISGSTCVVKNIKIVSDVGDILGLQILGDKCKVSDIEIDGFKLGFVFEGSRAVVENVKILRSKFGIKFTGSMNKLKTIYIEDCSYGLTLLGQSNMVSDFNCSRATESGIHILKVEDMQLKNNSIDNLFTKCEKNTLDAVKLDNMKVGVEIEGDGNVVKNLLLNKIERYGIWIKKSSRNSISSLSCSNVFAGVFVDGFANKVEGINVIQNGRIGVWLFRGKTCTVRYYSCAMEESSVEKKYWDVLVTDRFSHADISGSFNTIYIGGNSNTVKNAYVHCLLLDEGRWTTYDGCIFQKFISDQAGSSAFEKCQVLGSETKSVEDNQSVKRNSN